MKAYNFGFVLFSVFTVLSCKSDQPKELSEKIEIVELDYVQWACDCARFVEPQYIEEGLEGGELVAKCIFIEPSESVEAILDDYYMEGHHYSYLRLTGQYYIDKGIPSSYEQLTSERPPYARVFRYDKVEYVNKGV